MHEIYLLNKAAEIIRNAHNITVFTGAGSSTPLNLCELFLLFEGS